MLKINPIIEDKLREIKQQLRDIGLVVHERIEIEIESEPRWQIGRATPVGFQQTVRGRIEFIVPDSLLE